LIDPGAEEADLFGRKRFGRRAESTGTAGAALTAARRTRCAAVVTASRGTAGRTRGIATRAAAGTTWSALWRHSGFVIDLGGGDYERAVFAIAGSDDFPIFAALKNTFKIVEAQVGFGPLLAVTTDARSLKERLDVLVVSQIFLLRSGRKFGEIEFIEVEFLGRDGGGGSHYQAGDDQARSFLHGFVTTDYSDLERMFWS
jgi:hypothetical protein